MLQALVGKVLECTEEAMVPILQQRMVKQSVDADTLLQMDECAEAFEPEELEELDKIKEKICSNKSQKDDFSKRWRLNGILGSWKSDLSNAEIWN